MKYETIKRLIKLGAMTEREYLNSIDYDDYYPSYPDGADMFQVEETISNYDNIGTDMYLDYLEDFNAKLKEKKK